MKLLQAKNIPTIVLVLALVSANLVQCHNHHHKRSFLNSNSRNHSTSEEEMPGGLGGAGGQTFNYDQMGLDWGGVCKTGSFQSPINIVHEETSEIKGSIKFDYNLDSLVEGAVYKFSYDGNSLVLDAPIGSITYNDPNGSTRTYKAEKITLHYPSEHYVTHNGETPRFSLELQIEHTMSSSTNPTGAASPIKLEKSIVSLLFVNTSLLPDGDAFLANLGIDGHQVDVNDQIYTIQSGQPLGFNTIPGGVKEANLNNDTLSSLKNLLNFDHQIYRYLGSQTVPTCGENVEWFVFGEGRSISAQQAEFFAAQLVKEAAMPAEVLSYLPQDMQSDPRRGNNRIVQKYDVGLRGQIEYMPYGISSIAFQQGIKASSQRSKLSFVSNLF